MLIGGCRNKGIGSAAVVVVATLLAVSDAGANIFHSKEGALKLAFPTADVILPRHLFLTGEQLTRIERLCGEKPSSKLVTAYEGRKEGRVLGHAMIDTHVVRTLPETFMTVVDTTGRIQAVHILAFHEPLEYLTPPGWLAQFRRRRLSPQLRLRGAIAGIAGATLSAAAVARGTRRVLAIHQVALATRSRDDAPAPSVGRANAALVRDR